MRLFPIVEIFNHSATEKVFEKPLLIAVKWTWEKLIIILGKIGENVQHFDGRSGAESSEKIIEMSLREFI